jgi:hypothetical protein
MSITNVAVNASSAQPAWQANAEQFKQSFQSLGSALQSGDLSSAQQAFASLQQLQPSNSSSTSNLDNGPLSNDWNTLSQALQSGDTKAAQAAFTQLQSDIQTHRKGHHHHHQPAAANAPSDPSQNTSNADSDGDAAGTPRANVVA